MSGSLDKPFKIPKQLVWRAYERVRATPVRADYLDTVVWDHITGMLADPVLIHTEIDKRLTTARTADPVTQQRKRLNTALTNASSGITRMIEAFGEQLITIDELRARMPDLRARETNLRNQIAALDGQLEQRVRPASQAAKEPLAKPGQVPECTGPAGVVHTDQLKPLVV